MDMSGVNDFFKSFKEAEESGTQNFSFPNIETIIEESKKVKLNL